MPCPKCILIKIPGEKSREEQDRIRQGIQGPHILLTTSNQHIKFLLMSKPPVLYVLKVYDSLS